MHRDLTTELVNTMASRWWMLVARGAVAIAFGALALASAASAQTLLVLWGSYAVFDGVLCVLLASQRDIDGHPWGWLMFEGTVSLGTGLVALLSAQVSPLILLSWIALRAALSGIAEIAEALRVRDAIRGEWLLATCGVLSAAFGITMLLYRGAGALAAAGMIAAYAIVCGSLLIALGMRLHGDTKRETLERVA
jgi:uncharacterized membrane protein HdeD (DUF308 family)